MVEHLALRLSRLGWADPVLRDQAFWLRLIRFRLSRVRSSWRTCWGAAYDTTRAWPGMSRYRDPRP
jgi:hypothetical protein